MALAEPPLRTFSADAQRTHWAAFRVALCYAKLGDRDQAIADNLEYVASVILDVRRRYAVADVIVYAGFSQGVAMAYRAAVHMTAAGVIALGIGG